MKDYQEIVLPNGTFRKYPDRPYTWIQIPIEGQLSFFDYITKEFNDGNVKK